MANLEQKTRVRYGCLGGTVAIKAAGLTGPTVVMERCSSHLSNNT
jgi:hypothetical protein